MEALTRRACQPATLIVGTGNGSSASALPLLSHLIRSHVDKLYTLRPRAGRSWLTRCRRQCKFVRCHYTRRALRASRLENDESAPEWWTPLEPFHSPVELGNQIANQVALLDGTPSVVVFDSLSTLMLRYGPEPVATMVFDLVRRGYTVWATTADPCPNLESIASGIVRFHTGTQLSVIVKHRSGSCAFEQCTYTLSAATGRLTATRVSDETSNETISAVPRAPFNLSLTGDERAQKDRLVLPFERDVRGPTMPARPEFDDDDDDDSDPDADLDI